MTPAGDRPPGGLPTPARLVLAVCLLGCLLAGITALLSAWATLSSYHDPGAVALYLLAAVAAFGLPLVVFGRRV